MFEYPRLLTPGTGCGQSQMECGEMDSCEGETSSTFLLTLQRTGTPSVYQTCTIMHYNPPPQGFRKISLLFRYITLQNLKVITYMNSKRHDSKVQRVL